MPKLIQFRGHSDDTFGWDHLDPNGKRFDGDDHDDCANMKTRGFLVSSTTGRVVVTGVYGKLPGGTWAVGMGLMDEDEPWPEWAQNPAYSAEGYTPILSLLVPDDAEIELISIDGDKPEPEDD